MSSLSLTTRREAERAIVGLSGELDLATVPMLSKAALAELDSATCHTLVLDLEGLTFLDSTGLGCWIELRNLAHERHKSLELESVPASAMRTLTIAGLAPLFGLQGTARRDV